MHGCPPAGYPDTLPGWKDRLDLTKADVGQDRRTRRSDHKWASQESGQDDQCQGPGGVSLQKSAQDCGDH